MVSLEKKKCTSMKTNRRVFMPPPRPVKEECVIQARAAAYKSVWKHYLDTETKAGGNQEHHQLSRQERDRKKSLVKRVTAGELHIAPSDKGRSLVVMIVDMYHQMSLAHIEGDREVEWRELEESQSAPERARQGQSGK